MAAKITNEMRNALQQSEGKAVEVEDDQTRKMYVIVSREEFRDMQHRVVTDGSLSDDEMLAVAAQSLDDPDGWGAPGMDEYDQEANDDKK